MRRCLNPACAQPMAAHMRRDAKYCSDACSKRVRRAHREGLPDAEAPDRFWDGLNAIRRPIARRALARLRGAPR